MTIGLAAGLLMGAVQIQVQAQTQVQAQSEANTDTVISKPSADAQPNLSNLAFSNLKLQQGLSLIGVTGLQPSGLGRCEGELVFVSDKHDDRIFRIVLEQADKQQQTVPVTTYRELSKIPPPPTTKFSFWRQIKRTLVEAMGFAGGYDWEGITCDALGNAYLVSEYYFAVLKVSPEGRGQWITPSLHEQGVKAGAFQRDNAYLEGIVLWDEGLWLAVEREPRGLIQVPDANTAHFSIQAGPVLSDQGLPWDYTGLSVWQNQLYVLERNHHRVCVWRPVAQAAPDEMSRCYSFAYQHAQWGFESGPYGTAEGLLVEDQALWVITDNNGKPRLIPQGDQAGEPTDKRPILLQFAWP